MSSHCELNIVYSPVDAGEGFGSQEVPVHPRIEEYKVPTLRPMADRFGMYQSGIIKYLRQIRPDAVIIFANLRYLSFWTTIFWCKLHRIPVFPHGHGLYRKLNAGLIWKMIYKVVLGAASAYICYTPSVAKSLLSMGLPKKKIAVAENSLINVSPVLPEEKTGEERGIFFVGRLRNGCRLDHLISAVEQLHSSGESEITLHIVGDGPDAKRFKDIAKDMPLVRFYGQIYEPGEISKISRECMAGCYPGDAGLSIVHLMSLSLPPITHGDMASHQGPEPSYILSDVNGVLFDRKNPITAICSTLKSMIEQPTQLKSMQERAFSTYNQLINPSLATRFLKIVSV